VNQKRRKKKKKKNQKKKNQKKKNKKKKNKKKPIIVKRIKKIQIMNNLKIIMKKRGEKKIIKLK